MYETPHDIKKAIFEGPKVPPEAKENWKTEAGKKIEKERKMGPFRTSFFISQGFLSSFLS